MGKSNIVEQRTADTPGALGRSLADELPAELTRIERIPLINPDEDSILPYDSERPFNLNIYDDGPTQATGSHRASTGTGILDDTVYGLLAVYRQEVIEELGQWAKNHIFILEFWKLSWVFLCLFGSVSPDERKIPNLPHCQLYFLF